MSLQRKKKPVEFHFVDMNDPDRYKKLKVARACDFCRRRKSKCDIGVPGSGTCSNCKKHQMVCIFSPVLTTNNKRPEEIIMTPQQQQFNLFHQFSTRFPLLQIKDGQVGYEKEVISSPVYNSTNQQQRKEPTLELETKLFKLYFLHVHSAFPVLLKHTIMNIHNQDRFLLSTSLRYAIMAIACQYTQEEDIDSNLFYDTSKENLNLNSPRLDTIQSLLLLFKYNEIHCQFKLGIYFLEKAKEMINKIQSVIPQQQEMINRSRWILFGCISLSNLSDQNYHVLYKNIDLPIELPQPIKEEIDEEEDIEEHINRFSQIANLSVLYSHTIQNIITCSTNQLVNLTQFKEIRQHWHDSLHPITQSRLIIDKEAEIDILILYSAILYDMLYLLLLSCCTEEIDEWDGIETAYKLQRMIHTLVIRPSFLSVVQSRRMSAFALMLCLQFQLSREDDKIDFDSIHQIKETMTFIQLDLRIDQELTELCLLLNSAISSNTPQPQQQQPLEDYFSIIPQQFMNHVNTPSSIDCNINTPGLWSVTTENNNNNSTPLREDMGHLNYQVTSEWILEQQRRQDEQFQLYQLQHIPQYTTLPTTYTNNNNNNNNNNSINYSSSSNNTPLATTPSFNQLQQEEQDYFYFNPGQWSPSIEQLNTSTNYLKLHNNTPTREIPSFILQDLPK